MMTPVGTFNCFGVIIAKQVVVVVAVVKAVVINDKQVYCGMAGGHNSSAIPDKTRWKADGSSRRHILRLLRLQATVFLSHS